MNLKQILRISSSELKRSNTKINRKLLLILIPTLVLVLVLLFFFLSSDELFMSKFYKIEFSDDSREILLDQRFLIHKEGDIVVDLSNNVLIYNQDYFRSKAATELFIKNINLFNAFLIQNLSDELRFPVLIGTEIVESNQNIDAITFQPRDFGQYKIEDFIDDEKKDIDEIIEEDLIEDFEETISEEHETLIEDDLIDDDEIIESEIEKEIDEITINESQYLVTTRKERNKTDLISPSELSPSLPFEPIYLALIVVVILTFLSLIYSNRIYDEKVNSKGLLLLSSPVSNWDIIIGKTLPFIVISLLVAFLLGLFRTNNLEQALLLCLVAIPVTLVYFSISLFTALISRSFKELSFLGIFNISLYSLFLLIPAFLISFSEASLASPLTIIVKIILNETIKLNILLFSTLPSVFLAIIFFLVSSYLLTSENLFSYRSIASKIFNFYKENVYNFKRLFFITAFSIPFIFFIQLALIVVIVSLNTNDIYLLLLISAFVEEVFKSIGIYSLFKSGKIKKNIKNSIIAGTVTGAGFFIAEKLMLLLMISQFIEQYQLIIFSGLIIPLILHSLISIIFALGLRKSLRSFWIMLIIVTIIHFFANVIIINVFG